MRRPTPPTGRRFCEGCRVHAVDWAEFQERFGIQGNCDGERITRPCAGTITIQIGVTRDFDLPGVSGSLETSAGLQRQVGEVSGSELVAPLAGPDAMSFEQTADEVLEVGDFADGGLWQAGNAETEPSESKSGDDDEVR